MPTIFVSESIPHMSANEDRSWPESNMRAEVLHYRTQITVINNNLPYIMIRGRMMRKNGRYEAETSDSQQMLLHYNSIIKAGIW